MKVEFEIRKVTIIKYADSTDKIKFEIDGETPFPELSEQVKRTICPYLQIETRCGYAEEWLKKQGIDLEYNIIEIPR